MKKIRLGSLSILFTVLVLCVAMLSVLSVSTASADYKVAQRYADYVKTVNDIENLGNEWLSEMASALKEADNDIKKIVLPAETVIENNTASVEIQENGHFLDISVEIEGDGTINVSRWEISSLREEDDSVKVWDGNN